MQVSREEGVEGCGCAGENQSIGNCHKVSKLADRTGAGVMKTISVQSNKHTENGMSKYRGVMIVEVCMKVCMKT